MIFLEEEIKDTVQRLIASRFEVNYLKCLTHFLFVLNKIKDKLMTILLIKIRVVLLDHFGSLPCIWLMLRLSTHALCVEKIYIILDHISLWFQWQPVADERKELDLVMTELAVILCAANDICITYVSHNCSCSRFSSKHQKVKRMNHFGYVLLKR